MSDYKEKFEKMRVAGKLAAQTLDMLTANIKKVSQLITLINLGMNL
jgi:methionine aminopeptidase